MTVVIGGWLRQFKQSDKLEYEQRKHEKSLSRVGQAQSVSLRLFATEESNRANDE